MGSTIDFPSGVRFGDAAVGDLNNDGRLDVVVSDWTEGTGVSAISNEGSLLWTLALGGQPSTIAIDDMRRNGKPNIVVGTLGSAGTITLVDGEGHVLWSRDAKASVHITAFAALTGKGIKQIVAGTGGSGALATNAGVLFLNPAGQPIRFLPANWRPPQQKQKLIRDLVVSDLDQDGIDEIVMISDDEYGYVLRMRP